MLSNAMGLILADQKGVDLGALTAPRPLAAVPFGGRYRIIDFALSNLVNSGITNVGVVTQSKYKSLMDHLGTGLYWDLDRMNQGLQIIPPFINSERARLNGSDLTGTYEFAARGREDYVLILSTNYVCNADFRPMIEQHIRSGADVTIACNHDGGQEKIPLAWIGMDENGRVNDIQVGPKHPRNDVTGIGAIVLSREFFMEFLDEAIARGETTLNLDNLIAIYRKFKVCAYEAKERILRINDLADFFDSQIALLDTELFDHLFNHPDRPIYTKIKNEAPAYYEKGSFVTHSLVADGCIIEGSVSHSVLFRGVRVAKHVYLENSVIFQDGEIGDGADLQYVILDKNTVVGSGVRLQGHLGHPFVIEKEGHV